MKIKNKLFSSNSQSNTVQTGFAQQQSATITVFHSTAFTDIADAHTLHKGRRSEIPFNLVQLSSCIEVSRKLIFCGKG
ncbi:hypothetical protein EVA_11626 [gut metagenome]|uniref:Uncharacterized protein n=1 Tax=gut metagenome TaxID=749906 RepID=J9GER0_9ZZZZ